MCGRFVLFASPDMLQAEFDLAAPPTGLTPRYNIAPTQPVAVIANKGERSIEMFTWGLIPSWAKERSIGSRMINARAETLAEKPAFRAAFRKRRCLIVADGFYEWKKEGTGKTPMFIRLASQRPFAFAGLWEYWQPPGAEPVLSCTIITTDANALVSPIHDRMPVILPASAYDLWLDPAPREPAALMALLHPFEDEPMEAIVVSRLVNSPANEGPVLVEPA